MKNFIFALLLSSTTLFAQERISKNLGDFNALKVYSGLHVELIESATARIEIKGENSEDVIIKTKNGTLKLLVSVPNAFDHDNTLIRLYYTTDLELIDANQGSVITSDDKIKQDFAEIRAQEGAKIELRIKTQNLKVKSVTGGIVRLSGKALNQTVVTATGGIYEGFDLQSQNATVTSTTGGEAEVNVTGLLDAKVKLQGFIVYKERPENLKKKSLLGGTVCSMDDYRNKGGSRVYN